MVCKGAGKMKKFFIFMLALVSFSAFSWEGYDWEAGNYVEITEESYVSEGDEVEIYDYSAGEYRWVQVTDVTETEESVEVEVYDQTADKTRYLDMDNE
ncbi:hypothetical protein LAh8_49 [Aeromonas phage LAh_8]|uniref:Uncharacterized protein n=1 Tax=Aeromonas phage LAh_8 TaxID=2591032 RepID=A0A514A0M5_9CAUD|nr:hypothetical protein HWC31_gp049 [Aeromonas phage LAh_8]QDH46811.1 hypothetical protein LAh8_49 [Aeromonas phage LAh_8]